MRAMMIDLHGMTLREYSAEVRRRHNRKILAYFVKSPIVWFTLAIVAELALIFAIQGASR